MLSFLLAKCKNDFEVKVRIRKNFNNSDKNDNFLCYKYNGFLHFNRSL
jgi:hypothetical protein